MWLNCTRKKLYLTSSNVSLHSEGTLPGDTMLKWDNQDEKIVSIKATSELGRRARYKCDP